MAGISVNLAGMSTVLSNLDGFGRRFEGKVQGLIEKAVDTTYSGSQDTVPVLTGELKASGAKEVGKMSGSVSYGTNHAWYPEFGTVHMIAEPYLMPAFLDASAQLQADVKDLM